MDKKVNVQPIYSFSKQMLSLASGHDLFCSLHSRILDSAHENLDTKAGLPVILHVRHTGLIFGALGSK